MGVKRERIRKQNHWLDALYNACVAGHGCGVRLVDEKIPERPAPPPTSPDDYVAFGGRKSVVLMLFMSLDNCAILIGVTRHRGPFKRPDELVDLAFNEILARRSFGQS